MPYSINENISSECSAILTASVKAESIISYIEADQSAIFYSLPSRGTEIFMNDICNTYPKFKQDIGNACPKDEVLVSVGEKGGSLNITYNQFVSIAFQTSTKFLF